MTSRFVWVVLVAVAITVFPHAASAQTIIENKTRLVFEIKTLNNITLADLVPMLVTKNDESQTSLEPEVDPDIAVLQSYLEQKSSPLAPYAEQILTHENWKLVLAISNGESTMCKHQAYHNCWGVGGAWNMKRYASFAEGFADVNRFLTEKYVAKGADTPQKIVNKYVGHPNANWVYAVNKILTEVNQLPLQN